MSYAYSDGVVWLEPLRPEAHPMVHDLCAQHADNVRVPRGWELRNAFVTEVATEQLAAESQSRGYPEYRGPDQLDLIGA